MNTHDLDSEPNALEVAWSDHVTADTEYLNRLIKRYRERQRRYHKLGHIEAVVRHVDELAITERVDDFGAVIAAAFYHDAIYEPAHLANERASARLARRDLVAFGWPDDRVEAVVTMIEGTSHHTDPANTDTAVLFDADLAILGAEPDVYAQYVTKTRAEYNHFDDSEWGTGRAAVLRSFLDRDAIFATATGRDRWEAAARTNIAAELSRLHR